MLVRDRRQLVLETVRRDGSASIASLSAALGVSQATVRRDLLELERLGQLRRTHGGAFVDPAGPPSSDAGVPAHTDDPAADAKRRIAAAADQLIAEDTTIMLLGGTTTAMLLPHLRERRLTVVTNGLDIAHGLRSARDVDVVLLGGLLHRDQMTLVGPLTLTTMATLHVDVLVAGAYGVHPESGVTGAKVIQAGSHRDMLRHTDRLMLLADSGKLGRRGPSLLADVADVDTLITDTDADDAIVRRLRDAGVDVQLT